MDLPQSTQRAQREKQEEKRRPWRVIVTLDCIHSLSHISWFFRLCVLCGNFFLTAGDIHAAPQEIVLVDGAAFRGELVSIDAGGRATFRVADGKEKDGAVRTLSLEELVRWGNPVAPRRQTIVALVDGGRILTAADWAGGATVKLDNGDLVVASDIWDEVRLTRGLVSGIVFAQQKRADEREKLAGRVQADPSPAEVTDSVMLANGDQLVGKLTEFARGSLAIEARAGVVKRRCRVLRQFILAIASQKRKKSPPQTNLKKARRNMPLGSAMERWFMRTLFVRMRKVLKSTWLATLS